MRLRIGMAAVFFALSLLVVVPAWNVVMWMLTIAATEWGYWLAAAPLALLVWTLRRPGRVGKLVTSLLCLGAAGLFWLPVMEAARIARDLPSGLTQAFGPEPAGCGVPGAPLSFMELWRSPPPRDVHVRTLPYTAGDGTPLAIDFYANDAAGPRPCIIVVHGGAWQRGNEKELGEWNVLLAHLGYRVASISYRLAPAHHWPAQKEDLTAALALLKTKAGDLGIDANRFAFLGRSAGSQIILATAYALHDPSIRGCIGCYAPSDMVFDYTTGATHGILPNHEILTKFLGAKPEEAPEIYRDASAVQLAGADTPPTLLTHGTRDELVWIENSHRLRDRLRELHRPVYLLEMPWATHGFDANPSGPDGQLEYYAVTWFLGSVFQAK